jgi:hypothetical protein
MQQFIGGVKCRRVVLDKQMDSKTDRVRCEVGEERCNVCQEGLSRVKRNRNRESIGDAERELGRVRQIEERLEVGEQVEAEEQVEMERRRKENRREAEKRETEKREIEKRETEKREAEKREVERREAERMFKEEEQRHRVVRAERIRERVEIEKAKTEEIKEVFQDWIDRCVICKAEGREE